VSLFVGPVSFFFPTHAPLPLLFCLGIPSATSTCCNLATCVIFPTPPELFFPSYIFSFPPFLNPIFASLVTNICLMPPNRWFSFPVFFSPLPPRHVVFDFPSLGFTPISNLKILTKTHSVPFFVVVLEAVGVFPLFWWSPTSYDGRDAFGQLTLRPVPRLLDLLTTTPSGSGFMMRFSCDVRGCGVWATPLFLVNLPACSWYRLFGCVPLFRAWFTSNYTFRPFN